MTKKAKIEQYDSVARERDLFMFACHDMQNDLIHWGQWVSEADGHGKYRAGLSRQGSVLVTVWRYPGQPDGISVFDAVKEIENIRRLRNGSESWEPLQRAIDSAQDALRLASFVCTCRRGSGRHHPDCPRWDSHVDNYQEVSR
jgi:hypothetical protein